MILVDKSSPTTGLGTGQNMSKITIFFGWMVWSSYMWEDTWISPIMNPQKKWPLVKKGDGPPKKMAIWKSCEGQNGWILNHWILWDPICRQSQGCSERLKWANLNKAAGWLSFLPQPSGPRNTALLCTIEKSWEFVVLTAFTAFNNPSQSQKKTRFNMSIFHFKILSGYLT